MSFSSRLIVAAAVLVAAPAMAAKKAKVGELASAFTATTIDKQKLWLEALTGRVVVLNYWATWCAPCKAEMPIMDRFYRRHKAAGFELIGITTEGSLPAYALKKLDAVLTYPLAARSKGPSYASFDSAPTSFVIDRRGVLREIKSESFDEDEFNALILPLLAETAP